MKKIQNIGHKLSKTEQKKIKGGDVNPSCPIGKPCYNWYTNSDGICYPGGSSGCICKVGGAGVYSIECTADV